ncbi:MAG: RluA family pseudouridine synthase [Spirochaetaceae bacterium]|jgi:23S rRNA pseudouridine955/2504/2580 synthase|nr:RluA family pseudouridine synthase [Spirochaetaceae bacterium]
MNRIIALIACENDSGRRLDRILRKQFPAFSLSFINRLLRKKKVLVNGNAREGGYRVACGDRIEIKHAGEPETPDQTPGSRIPEPETPESKRPSLCIVYEDDDLLVVDKPAGMLTHGTLDTPDTLGTPEKESLASAVTAYLADKIPASLSFRPGPLHRLDRNTSGLVVFGKSLKGAQFFTQATQNGHVKKYYLAIVDGVLEKEAVWEDYLVRDKAKKITRAANGDSQKTAETAKKAVLRVRPIKTENGATLIEAEISSGKTHQIRVQCNIHGHPLRGDKKYGGSFQKNSQKSSQKTGYFLRAYKIVIHKYGGPLVLTVPEQRIL